MSSDDARETARRPDGRFGSYTSEEQATGSSMSLGDGDGESPSEPTTPKGWFITPLLAAKLPAWPEGLGEPTYEIEPETGNVILHFDNVSLTRTETYLVENPPVDEGGLCWDDYPTLHRVGVHSYGRALGEVGAEARRRLLRSPAFVTLLGDTVSGGGDIPSTTQQVLAVAEANNVAVAYQDRRAFESEFRDLSDSEWERIQPHLGSYDEFVDSGPDASEWRYGVLHRAGVEETLLADTPPGRTES